MKLKKQKPSWQYLRHAFAIQVAPRHHAAKLVLLFLADRANDFGESFHGYRSISAHLQLSHKAIHDAITYLKDVLCVLTWTPGSGGFNKKDTNHYKLNLDSMKNVVEKQGVFGPETLKLVYSPLTPQYTTEAQSSYHSKESVVLPESGSRLTSRCTVVLPESESRLTGGKHNPQLNRTHNINPQLNPEASPTFFKENKNVRHDNLSPIGQVGPAAVCVNDTATSTAMQFRGKRLFKPIRNEMNQNILHDPNDAMKEITHVRALQIENEIRVQEATQTGQAQ